MRGRNIGETLRLLTNGDFVLTRRIENFGAGGGAEASGARMRVQLSGPLNRGEGRMVRGKCAISNLQKPAVTDGNKQIFN